MSLEVLISNGNFTYNFPITVSSDNYIFSLGPQLCFVRAYYSYKV